MAQRFILTSGMHQELLAAPGFAVAIIGPDLLLKKANLGFCKLFKFPSIPYGLPVAELISTRDKESFVTQLVTVFDAHPFTARPFGFLCGDGSSFLQGCQVIRIDQENRQPDLALLWKLNAVSAETRLDQFQASILNQLKDAVVVTDLQARIVYWNRSAEELFGLPANIAMGRPATLLPHARMLADALAQISGDSTARLSGEWERSTGRWLAYEITGWFDPQGELQGLISIGRDVTHRRNVADELRESEQFYRTMFDDSPVPMYLYDVDSLRILEANQAAIRFYEYSLEQFRKLSVYDLRPEDEKARFAEQLEVIRYTQLTGELQSGFWIHQSRSGKLLHVEVLSHATLYRDKRARLAIIRDISRERLQALRLKESEQRLSQLFEQSEEAIITYDRQGRVTGFNRNMAQLIQHSEKTTVEAGMLLEDFLQPEAAASWRTIIAKALEGEPTRLDYKHITADGDTLVATASVQPFRVDGAIAGAVVFAKDKSQMQRNEYLLEATSQMALIGGWEYNIRRKSLRWTDMVYHIHEVPAGSPVTVEQAIGFYHSESQPVISEAFNQLLHHGKRFDLTLKLISATGKLRWVRAIGELESVGDQVVLVKGTLQDITEGHERQLALDAATERLETATNAARIGVWEIAAETGTMYWNKTNFDIHGIEPTSDLAINGSIPAIFKEDQLAHMRQKFEALNDSAENFQIDYSLDIKGQIRHFHSFGKPHRKTDGTVLRLVGITQDVTEMLETRQKIETALREKETLLSEIHHRVKNNFSVITSLFGLHINSSSDPNLRSILTESRKRIMSMALVHEKLYRTKSLSAIEFDTYVKELIDLIRSGTEQKTSGIQILIHSDPILLDIVRAVPFGLLLNELVSNSLKHAFGNQLFGTISITLSKTDAGLHFIYLDDGCGFDFNEKTNASETLGIVLINLLLRQLKAVHKVGKGTGFSLECDIPLT
jgi:PAS domain S-box-containing protein